MARRHASSASTSASWCPATSSRSASATSSRPTCGSSRPTSSSATRACSPASRCRRPRRSRRPRATRRSTFRRARSWARSCTRAPAEAVVVATGSATAFGKIAVGLGERPGRDRVPGRAARLLQAARAGGGRAHDLDLRDQRRASPARCSRRCCSPWPSPSGSRRSCCRPSSASACRPAPEQLARRRVLVKRLVTIEDLGNIEVLFTDKTGTLTEGAITFDQALDPAGRPATAPLLLGLVCNEATMTADGPVGGNALDVGPVVGAGGRRRSPGGPTARPATSGSDSSRSTTSASSPRCSCAPPDGDTLLVTKGAPEAVLARCVDPPPERARDARPAVRRRRPGRRRRHARRPRARPSRRRPTSGTCSSPAS